MTTYRWHRARVAPWNGVHINGSAMFSRRHFRLGLFVRTHLGDHVNAVHLIGGRNVRNYWWQSLGPQLTMVQLWHFTQCQQCKNKNDDREFVDLWKEHNRLLNKQFTFICSTRDPSLSQCETRFPIDSCAKSLAFQAVRVTYFASTWTWLCTTCKDVQPQSNTDWIFI